MELIGDITIDQLNVLSRRLITRLAYNSKSFGTLSSASSEGLDEQSLRFSHTQSKKVEEATGQLLDLKRRMDKPACPFKGGICTKLICAAHYIFMSVSSYRCRFNGKMCQPLISIKSHCDLD